jgi:prepilin-type N-terminal cleavage/methylation domain-containing protein
MGVPGQNRTDDMLGRKHRESGFTLIEVMIVCAIIGIASALAIPSYTQWKADHDLREAVSEFSSDLNLARVVAMNRNRQATVTIQLTGGLINVSGIAAGAPIFSAQILNQSVTGLPGGTTNVAFSSMGLSKAAANQVIQIVNARGLVYSVSVMPSGKVTWCPTSTCP